MVIKFSYPETKLNSGDQERTVYVKCMAQSLCSLKRHNLPEHIGLKSEIGNTALSNGHNTFKYF